MRIYLVEEENIVRQLIRDSLTDLGHEVIVLDALDELSDTLGRNPRPVDLIIVDLPTPKREAIAQGMREVHRRHPEIPLVVRVSGALLSADEAVQCGVHAYLHKPIRLAELELMLIRLSETRKEFRISSNSQHTDSQLPSGRKEARLSS